MLLVASETGHVYTFATPKLQPMITSETGKALIQTCLHQPDPPNTIGVIANDYDMRMSANGYEETELGYQVPEEDFKGSIHDPSCLIPVSSATGIPVMPLNGMPHGMIPMQGFAAMHPEMSVMTHGQMVPTHQNTQVMSPQHSSPPPSYSPPGHPSSPHRANTFNGNSYPNSPPSVPTFSQGPAHHQQVMMEEIPYDQRSPSQSPIQHRYSHSPQGGLYSSNGSPRM
jgi:serum response factor